MDFFWLSCRFSGVFNKLNSIYDCIVGLIIASEKQGWSGKILNDHYVSPSVCNLHGLLQITTYGAHDYLAIQHIVPHTPGPKCSDLSVPLIYQYSGTCILRQPMQPENVIFNFNLPGKSQDHL